MSDYRSSVRGGMGMDAMLLQTIRRKASRAVEDQKLFFRLNDESLLAVAKLIAAVYRGGGRMFAMGSGASGCLAAHLAVNFSYPLSGRRSLPVISLNTDSAIMSAAGDAEQTMAAQIQVHGSMRDGVIGLSATGHSESLLAGFAAARELGMRTLGLAGGGGGDMLTSGLVDHCLTVESDSAQRVQEIHLISCNIIADMVHALLVDQR